MQPTLPVATTAALRARDVRELAFAQARRDLRLQHVVRACGAATQMTFGDLADLETRGREQPARLCLDLLAVLHRARGVIRDRELRHAGRTRR